MAYNTSQPNNCAGVSWGEAIGDLLLLKADEGSTACALVCDTVVAAAAVIETAKNVGQELYDSVVAPGVEAAVLAGRGLGCAVGIVTGRR